MIIVNEHVDCNVSCKHILVTQYFVFDATIVHNNHLRVIISK